MKVVICGAGQVGCSLAKYMIEEKYDVTLIDASPEAVKQASNTLDAEVVLGNSSYPENLNLAGAHEADLLIAVTKSDEVNMLTCQVAHSLFHVATKIARIRDEQFLLPHWMGLYQNNHLPVDYIISPEQAVATQLEEVLRVGGAFSVHRMMNFPLHCIGIICLNSAPFESVALKHLSSVMPDFPITIAGIVRDQQLIIPQEDDLILPQDQVFCLVHQNHLHQVPIAFGYGHQERQRVIILGGGGVGRRLIDSLIESKRYDVIVVEHDERRAKETSRRFKDAITLYGDALDVDLLQEASVHTSDGIVCVTNDDKTNILSGLIAKKMGGKRTICLANTISLGSSLMSPLGIDAIVTPRNVTVTNVLRSIQRSRMSYSMNGDGGEIMLIEILTGSPMIGKTALDINKAQELKVLMLIRKNLYIEAFSSEQIQEEDWVILSLASKTKKTLKILGLKG